MYVEWEKIVLPKDEIPLVFVTGDLADAEQDKFSDKPMLYDKKDKKFKGLNIFESFL